MKYTWEISLIDLLKKARLGETEDLQLLINKYAPFIASNEEYTTLLLLRNFHVQFWKDERRILNAHPESEDFQRGITVVTSSEKIGSQSNVFLPNRLKYIGINISGDEITILEEGNKSILTNTSELLRKLQFWGLCTENDIDLGYKSLCNEVVVKKIQTKKKNIPQSIQIPSFGTLNYNEDSEFYEGKVTDGKIEFNVSVEYATPKKIEKLIIFAEKQLQQHFYNKVILEAESSVIELKNDSWLSENENSGEEEFPITAEELKKKISLNSISFFEDCSSEICYNDGDVFWGHYIVIDVDKKGKFTDFELAG